MLTHLKIIWQFHQKVSIFFGPRYIGDDFFLGPNLVSFNRAVVPLFELLFLTKSQKLTSAQKQQFLSVCKKRFNKLNNINISKTSQQNDFYCKRVPGFSGIGRTREGTRLQDHLCALCQEDLHQLSVLVCYTERVYKASNFFLFVTMSNHFVKKS